MSRILLGCTPPGRYPRWGYLDRLETNEAMPRACVISLGSWALLGLLAFLVHSFWPAMSPIPERVDPTGGHVIAPFPTPLPPPSIQVQPGIRLQPIPPSVSGNPVLVEDEFVPDPSPWNGPAGDLQGTGTAQNLTELLREGEAWGGLAGPSPLPRRDDFVAVEHEPELVLMPEPVYPELARDAGIEGTVLVRALVGADGLVLETLVLQSVLGLDEAALEAVAGAAFRPAQQQGRPVAAWVVVPIQFSLRP